MALAVPLPPRLGDPGTCMHARLCPPHPRISPCKVGGGQTWQPPPLHHPFALHLCRRFVRKRGSPRGAVPALHPAPAGGPAGSGASAKALSPPPAVTHGQPGGETAARPPACRRNSSREPRPGSPRGPGSASPSDPASRTPRPGCFRLPLLLRAPGGEAEPGRPPRHSRGMRAAAGGSCFSSSSLYFLSLSPLK